MGFNNYYKNKMDSCFDEYDDKCDSECYPDDCNRNKKCNCCCKNYNFVKCPTGPIGPTGATGVSGPRGATGATGPTGASGILDSAFIFSRILTPSTVEVNNNIPFPLTILSQDISNIAPFTTFNFLETGYYLLTLSITTDIQQISAIVTNTGGPQVTTYTLSAITETKTLNIIIDVTEIGTTLSLQNSLGEGAITSANITINKIAEI